MKQKIALAIAAALILAASMFAGGYATGLKHREAEAVSHEHGWTQWEAPVAGKDSPTDHLPGYVQFRRCTNCGMAEIRSVVPSK